MIRLAELLARGRAAAKELQQETIRLYRPAEGNFDWDTGTGTPGADLVLYDGAARVKPASSQGQEVDAGEQNVTLRDYNVSLPWAAPRPSTLPRPGDVIDVITSPDARMPGLRLWVTGGDYSSTATAWRIRAEDRS
ncbi:DUF6093 family protein [Streptomyces sp. NPDC055036]